MIDCCRLVVCDLAGTTVRDDGQVGRAFRTALAAHGVDVTDAQIAAVRGMRKRDALESLLPDVPRRGFHADFVHRAFCDALQRELHAHPVQAIGRAEEALVALRSHGIRVVLNTGFEREIAHLVLDSLRWSEGLADAVVCGDDVERGRPAPDLIRRAMTLTRVTTAAVVASVGDTALDLRAGAAAGVGWNIGVLSGAHTRAQLEAEPHSHLVASIATAADLLLGRR